MSHDQREEGESSQDRWLVSYADFMTLMFAFFAVLYATSQKDVEKAEKFQDSVKKFLIKAGAFGESGPQLNQGEKHNSPIESPIQTFKPEKIEAATGLDEAETFIEAKISKAERDKYIMDISADEWGVRIQLQSGAIFASQSDKFKEDAMAFLTKLSGLLSATKRKVLIEGHVAKGETGAFKSTWDFSSARSINMLRFMMKKENLESNRLAAASFGDSRPMFEGPQAHLNSRLEIVLLNSDVEL